MVSFSIQFNRSIDGRFAIGNGSWFITYCRHLYGRCPCRFDGNKYFRSGCLFGWCKWWCLCITCSPFGQCYAQLQQYALWHYSYRRNFLIRWVLSILFSMFFFFILPLFMNSEYRNFRILFFIHALQPYSTAFSSLYFPYSFLVQHLTDSRIRFAPFLSLFSLVWCWICDLFTICGGRIDNRFVYCTFNGCIGWPYNWFACADKFRAEASWAIDLVDCFRHLCGMHYICHCLQFTQYWNGRRTWRNWSGESETAFLLFGDIK